MDYFSSSTFDPLYPQFTELLHNNNNNNNNNIPDFIPLTQSQLQAEDDQLIPTFEPKNNDPYHLFHEIPPFVEDPPQKTSHHIVQPHKRSLESSLTAGVNHNQENEKNSNNERKKKQKILHREAERQRRLEMSSLHTSLKSLLPLEDTQGKRSISDHLEETVKYISQMQRNIQVLIDRRDGLRKQVSTFKEQQEHDVIVNVFKGCLEVIVTTNCVDVDDDDDGEQGLPLSKVLQCLIQEGFEVVNSISTRVNHNIVHSIHAEVGDKDSIAIDAKNLKQKLANIKR